MLKYDLTIDKFLGDGVLAFCNAPLRRTDHVSRVVRAALEIREKIFQSQDFYERNWLSKLDIRIGIARGFANVGFYGSGKYYRNYTAIGPVINLASRLCSSGEANQILCDYDIFMEIQNDFEFIFVGKKILKGFDQDLIHVYEVKKVIGHEATNIGECECTVCGFILSLETNEKGQFIFVCKNCYSASEDSKKTDAHTSPKVA